MGVTTGSTTIIRATLGAADDSRATAVARRQIGYARSTIVSNGKGGVTNQRQSSGSPSLQSR